MTFVLDIFVQPAALSLFSHLTTFPVLPDNVIIPVEEPWHKGVVPPVILPPTDSGLTVTVISRLVDGQFGTVVYLLITLTVLLPAAPPMLTVICRVPWPAVIVQPAGTVHKYSVGPPTGITGGLAATEKICPAALTHTSVGPVITPGWERASLILIVICAGGPSQSLAPLVSVTQ